MDDLISRQAAVDALEGTDWYHQDNNLKMVLGANDAEHQAWYKSDDVYKAINSVPSAQPEQRKKGEWSNYKDEHCCSVCKCVVISDCWNDEIRYDYCPYCGADMRGE